MNFENEEKVKPHYKCARCGHDYEQKIYAINCYDSHVLMKTIDTQEFRPCTNKKPSRVYLIGSDGKRYLYNYNDTINDRM